VELLPLLLKLNLLPRWLPRLLLVPPLLLVLLLPDVLLPPPNLLPRPLPRLPLLDAVPLLPPPRLLLLDVCKNLTYYLYKYNLYY
jgi:hypothetical protein